MNKFLLMAGAAALVSQVAMAQERTITGVVVSAEDGLPMTGVAIIDKATNNGVTTDIDGKFTITVSPKTRSLNLSYLGFKAVDARIEGSTSASSWSPTSLRLMKSWS